MPQIFPPHHATHPPVHDEMCPFVQEADVGQFHFLWRKKPDGQIPNQRDAAQRQWVSFQECHAFVHLSSLFDANVILIS